MKMAGSDPGHFVLHLSPHARGEVAAPSRQVRGKARPRNNVTEADGIILPKTCTEFVEAAPHPNPLPAKSGARERTVCLAYSPSFQSWPSAASVLFSVLIAIEFEDVGSIPNR
jgi:hypothetical protein